MAKRATTPKKTTQPEKPIRICDDCGNGVWVDSFSNIDWEGKPIYLTCPFEQYHILRGRKACANWIPKPKEAEQ